MNRAPLTVALAGAGRASVAHAVAARTLRLPVVAVASRRPATAAARAEEVGARPVDAAELPAGAALVVVCTPPPHHAEVARRCLAAGAAVLVERPLCATLADADALVEAAEVPGRWLAYGENLAWAPAVLEMLRRLPALGPLRHLGLRALQDHPGSVGFTDPAWGGGALAELGSRLVALAVLAARPARPVAVAATLVAGEGGLDRRGEVALRFDSGLVARLEVAWDGPAVATWDVQAAGDDGVVRAELLPRPGLEHDGQAVALPPVRTDPGELDEFGYLGQLAAVAADAAAGRTPFLGARAGRDVWEVVSAAYASAGSGGAPVALPFTGRRDRTPLELWRGA